MIDRFVRVLESFDTGRPTLSTAELGRRAGLPPSTAHRFAQQLVEAGLLERDEAGELRVGLRLWELTTRGSRALELRRRALPAMGRIQARVREHTQLAVLEGDSALCLERLSAAGSGANITRIAGRLPLHASSSGLVLLAHADDAVRERVLARPLPRLAPETVTDPAELRRLLARIRRDGEVRTVGTVEHRSSALAVPVLDGERVVAALSVVLPREHGAPDATMQLLRRGAAEISAALSTRRPADA